MTTHPYPRAGHRRTPHGSPPVPLEPIAGNDTPTDKGNEMGRPNGPKSHDNCPTCNTEVGIPKGVIVGVCPECDTTWNIRPGSIRPNRMVRDRNRIDGIR